jgi:hypothetical protein
MKINEDEWLMGKYSGLMSILWDVMENLGHMTTSLFSLNDDG